MKATVVLVSPNPEPRTSWASALEPRFEVRFAPNSLEAATLVGPNVVLVADFPALGLDECERLLASLIPGAIAVVHAGAAMDDDVLAALLAKGALDVVVGPVSPEALAARVSALLRTRLPREIRAKLVENASLALVGLLSRGIVHDLGNPLAFVLANLRTLREYRAEIAEALGPSARSGPLATILEDLGPLLDESLEGASRIDAILQTVRTFVRPDPGTVSSVDVREAVLEALDLLKYELRNVELDVQLAGGIRVTGSETGLRQLMAHLLFATMRVLRADAPCRIVIRGEAADETARIRVEALPVDGAGYDETWRAHFAAGGSEGDTSSLSLACAQMVLREHSGTIHCELAGDALRFAVELPL